MQGDWNVKVRKDAQADKEDVVDPTTMSRQMRDLELLELATFNNLPLVPPGRVAQSVGHRTRKSGVLGSIPGLATYSRFSFRFFTRGSCQILAKVCARSTG